MTVPSNAGQPDRVGGVGTPPSGAPGPSGRTAALVYTCFFLSGASALVYEVVWMRQLLLTLGSTTSAVSTVLATFMMGLALGARALGGVADRTRDPLRLYAYLEAGIGVYAVVLPRLMEAVTPFYVTAARALEGSPLALGPLRIASAGALLLFPTILMGATLPVLMRFAGSSRSLGRHLGLLYGTNVAGAVVGCTATGFVLIRFLGVSGANMVAVLVNLSIAALVLLTRRGVPPATDSAPGQVSVSLKADRSARPALWVAVGLSGFVTMGCEVLWTRMLVFSFSSTVYAFTVILATFLTGLALGSWVFGTMIAGRRESLQTLAAVEITAGVLALLLVPLGARAYDLIGTLSEYIGYSGTAHVLGTALSSALLMLPPAVLMGVVFPMASRRLLDDSSRVGRRIGGAYLVNSVGGALGALVVPFALMPLLSIKGAFVLLSGLQFAVAWLLLAYMPISAPKRLAAVAGSVGALGVCLLQVEARLSGPNPFDPPSRSAERGSGTVIAHRDATTASVSVVQYASQVRSLRIDGFEAAAADPVAYAYMRLMSHLPLLLHPDPRSLLVISVGTGSTAGAGLLHAGLRIDAVDINRAVLDFAGYFEKANGGVLAQPQARAILDDGRNYLLVSRRTYDVITSEPMPPTFAGMVNLYSREYYVLAKERLNPGGYVVQWLPFHLLNADEALAIVRTVQSVLPETSLWMIGRTGIIVARRDGPVEIDFAAMRRRTQTPAFEADLQATGIFAPEKLVSFYGLGSVRLAQLTSRSGLITDDHPSLEFHAPRHTRYRAPTGYRRDEFELLHAIHSLRIEERIPLRHATSDESELLREYARSAASISLSILWTAQGEHARSRQVLNEALANTATPITRARLLYYLAAAAKAEGLEEESKRLMKESWALAPEVPLALEFRPTQWR